MPIRVKRNQTLELKSSFANPPTGGSNGDINPFSRQMASDADMQIDCKIAIGIAIRDLVCAIIQAGWSPGIAYSALKNVAKTRRSPINTIQNRNKSLSGAFCHSSRPAPAGLLFWSGRRIVRHRRAD